MKNRVVVTGMGCVSPLGNDLPTTWANLKEGRSGIGSITYFDTTDYRTTIAGELKGFDPTIAVEESECKKMDSFIQFALVAAKEAVADSGVQIDEELSWQTGVSVGIGIGGLSSIEKWHQVYLEKGSRRITPFFIPMVITNMAAGYISLHHKCRGYNTCTTSACSSSSHSIGDAARIIERGDAKVMISGGAESSITPLGIGGFAAMRALSTRNDDPTTASRPYDVGRDGFVMGEGAAIVVLEELEHARKRGAHIYCELIGYGFSSDAHHITAPNSEGPCRAMKMALKDGGLNPEQLDYVNTHGTSTPLGDINELKAIKQAVGESNAKHLILSSSKSMTGHLLGAAGAFESMVSIKALEEGVITPTINVDELDPECDLDITPNQARNVSIKTALSNSFGFGGTNATLLFQSI